MTGECGAHDPAYERMAEEGAVHDLASARLPHAPTRRG